MNSGTIIVDTYGLRDGKNIGSGGAAIGGGYCGAAGTITINGGTITSASSSLSVAGGESVATSVDPTSSSDGGVDRKDIRNFLPREAVVNDAFFAENALHMIWSNVQTTELWETKHSLETRQVVHESRLQEPVNEAPRADLERGVVFFGKAEVPLPLYTANSSIAISPNGKVALYIANEKRTVIALDLLC